jgi:hypothetical protein
LQKKKNVLKKDAKWMEEVTEYNYSKWLNVQLIHINYFNISDSRFLQGEKNTYSCYCIKSL